MNDFERRLSASMLRLRAGAPFYAALCLFARVLPTHEYATAATDGRDIWVNPHFWAELSSTQCDGLLLHEVLHCALLHIPRRGPRDPLLWNIAGDIVINGIITSAGFELPHGALRDQKLQELRVEEAYELLLNDSKRFSLTSPDLLESSGHGDGVAAANGPMSEERRRNLEVYWRHAREQASTLAQAARGSVPSGLKREWRALEAAQLDWRAHLWRYLARTPVDYQGFDRRFVGRGLYLDALEGETLRAFVCIDTSGSVSGEQMNRFLSEVQGILGAYPQVSCDLFFADSALHGPFPLRAGDALPSPVGGGGTDFRPFFARIEDEAPFTTNICVYLTDGLGAFPDTTPAAPTLWVVTPGGLDDENFPFGEVARLLTD